MRVYDRTTMIRLEIVSDFICPWCFIGTRRLASALAQLRADDPGFVCDVRWRPYFLNSDTPPDGEPYRPFLERKFGGPAPVEALFERVREAGRTWGLDYAFERIAIRANTLRAHRLVHWAEQQGDVAALVERIFVAQFQRGDNIGDMALLARLAGESGFDAAAALSALESGADEAIVKAREREARELGINMVPTFIVGGRDIVVGAEDPAILADALRRHQQGKG